MSFGKKTKRQYKAPGGMAITQKEHIKDLGIHMSNTGDFNHHIYEAVKATQKIASWALRTFRSRGKLLLRTLLKSVIVPKLEYGAIVWAPTNAGRINLIENIQRKFTSRIGD